MTLARYLPAFLVLASVTAGCANAPAKPAPTVRLSLLQTLEIPPGEAGVRLQYGRTAARNGVQEVDPHCIFELDTVSESAQVVQPGPFRVTRVQRREVSFSGMPLMFWDPLSQGIGPTRNPSNVYFLTEFRLQSDSQPNVRSLLCQHNQAAAGITFPRHLTLAEMRQALGNYFSLELTR